MDLNQLLFREQVSLMRAASADCVEARHAHRGLAALYARRVADARMALGVLPVPVA